MKNDSASLPPLQIILAAPRGFCAGVDRAIQIVEQALEKYGAPVYVRHEIVHNRHVVERLEGLGAIFVEELDEVPNDRPVIFSAHGVPKSVPAEAQNRNMIYVDATCPLVSKVHVEANQRDSEGYDILLIGHAGHPEVIGTMGQLDDGHMTLIETPEDAENVSPRNPEKLVYTTQTTLSVDDTAEIIGILEKRFPKIRHPHKEDICYATTNRQQAVKSIAKNCDVLFVVGAPNSSNSMRLVEVAQKYGCKQSQLLQKADEIDWEALGTPQSLGLTAGASAPEELVTEVIDALKTRFDVKVDEVVTNQENITFKLPRILND